MNQPTGLHSKFKPHRVWASSKASPTLVGIPCTQDSLLLKLQGPYWLPSTPLSLDLFITQ